MQVSLTLTFGPGEDALFEAAVSKIATLGAVLKQAAAAAGVLPERAIGKSPALAAPFNGQGPATPGDPYALSGAVPDLAKHSATTLPSTKALDPFAPAEDGGAQEAPAADASAQKKRGGARKSRQPTTQDVLGPAPAAPVAPTTVEQKQPPAEDIFSTGPASALEDVSVEQLQKLSTEIITKQPNDRQEVMDCVYSFKTDKDVRAVSWKDLSAPQRVEAMKKLREIYLGDSIPFK
jgi:hypothetical protein